MAKLCKLLSKTVTCCPGRVQGCCLSLGPQRCPEHVVQAGFVGASPSYCSPAHLQGCSSKGAHQRSPGAAWLKQTAVRCPSAV